MCRKVFARLPTDPQTLRVWEARSLEGQHGATTMFILYAIAGYALYSLAVAVLLIGFTEAGQIMRGRK